MIFETGGPWARGIEKDIREFASNKLKRSFSPAATVEPAA
jgi:hypothetical protein